MSTITGSKRTVRDKLHLTAKYLNRLLFLRKKYSFHKFPMLRSISQKKGLDRHRNTISVHSYERYSRSLIHQKIA
ncbi:MAG: hypothetical protein DUD39_11340 [Coriobacteriaceae bacterium]|nr:MAG: hypothetical protein DUD39_11340 [Coriobacteriaceae bacterium]